ncbi:actin cytoskeleton-regulatory complex protein PAN1-like [Folsomia candida]|uniref:Nipped-B-like protein B n=1 Tax=Folsomia candida TaxID=158441 RepID=A0A226DE16_FOLCA|nr:actin cytoskeleton-regulatory complex protein PAN1-like [Folsomia candida]OXA43370.1 Nipped-B-like protein B [Folsomia candida]
MFPPPAHPAHPPILKGLKGPHHPPEEGGGCCPCSAPQQQRGHVGFGRGHVGFGRGQGHGPPRGGFQFRPRNQIPLRCGATPQNYCGCTEDETAFRKRLPHRPGVTFCSDGHCNTACAGFKAPAKVCGPGNAVQNPALRCHRPIFTTRQGHERGHGGNHDDDRPPGHERGQGQHHDRPQGHNRKKRHRHRSDSSSSCSDRCEHGVCYPSRHRRRSPPPCPPPAPPTVIEREKPVVIVHNTELCECESKWKLIERWQTAAKKRESDRVRDEDAAQRKRAKERYKKRIETQKRHRECLVMQKELERRRCAEEDDWRRRRVDMEDKRLAQEYDMWLADLLEGEEARRQVEVLERNREAKRWREEQLKPRDKRGLAVPELEELRRVLAPLDKGPNEIFEFFALEPKPDPPPKPCCPGGGQAKGHNHRHHRRGSDDSEDDSDGGAQDKKSARAVAEALMGMRTSDGIHIRVGDQCQKKATLRLNMGPCLGPMQNGGLRSLTIGGGGEANCCPPPAPPPPGPLIPPEVVQIMMKIKEAHNPLLKFSQTTPNWATVKGRLNLPMQPGPGCSVVAPSMAAQYYSCPYYYPPPC